jgi:hypothetical protein
MHRHHQKSFRDLKLSVYDGSVCSSRTASTVNKVHDQNQKLLAISGKTEESLSAGLQGLRLDLQELRSSMLQIRSQETAQLSWSSEEVAEPTIQDLKGGAETSGDGTLRMRQLLASPTNCGYMPIDRIIEKPKSQGELRMTESYPRKRNSRCLEPRHSIACSSFNRSRAEILSPQPYSRVQYKENHRAFQRILKEKRAISKSFCLKLPTCRRRMLVNFWRCNYLTLSFQIQITFHNCISPNSPIFHSCLNFDLGEVQRLFDARLASPFDRNYINLSLIEVVLMKLFTDKLPAELMSKALELLRFLVNCTSGLGNVISSYCMSVILRSAALCQEMNELRTDAMRLILNNSVENPFDDVSVGLFLSLAVERSSLFELVKKQDIWDIEWNTNTVLSQGSHFLENDRQMLLDPNAEQMHKAILENRKYSAIVPEWGIDCGLSSMHSLLRLAKASGWAEVSRCCEIRISILLLNGFDARLESRCPGLPWEQYPKSPTKFAASLGMSGLWISALHQAGWTAKEIEELLDEETYFGVPELLSGSCTYQTQRQCRMEFVDNLSRGYFITIPAGDLAQISKQIGWNIGVFMWGQVLETILEANSVYSQRSMPGTWQQEKALRLIPEVDFYLPEYDMFEREIDWQGYIDVVQG